MLLMHFPVNRPQNDVVESKRRTVLDALGLSDEMVAVRQTKFDVIVMVNNEAQVAKVRNWWHLQRFTPAAYLYVRGVSVTRRLSHGSVPRRMGSMRIR